MTLHDVSAHRVTRAERTLEVDLVAGAPDFLDYAREHLSYLSSQSPAHGSDIPPS